MNIWINLGGKRVRNREFFLLFSLMNNQRKNHCLFKWNRKKKTRDGTKIHLHRIKAKNKKKDKTNEKKKKKLRM